LPDGAIAPQVTKARHATTSEPRDRLFSVDGGCVLLEWGRRAIAGAAVRVQFTAPCHFQIIAQPGACRKAPRVPHDALLSGNTGKGGRMSSEVVNETHVGPFTEPKLHLRSIDANASGCATLVCGSLPTLESRRVGVSR
jgi:hypothetical protein